jgi:class 3 adenylate cyclase/tetratricopeptide (TPR) repeat protein
VTDVLGSTESGFGDPWFAPRVFSRVVEEGVQFGFRASNAKVLELDATLVFGDISGFTSLSERLAIRGRIGSELINQILSISFTALLDLAESLGGDLVSFGGDALCLLFDGPQHVERGVAAAYGLRAALRRTAAQRAPIDKGTLRISTGVHSGRVILATVGAVTPMLAVLGPVVTRTLELESAADGGEVFVSSTVRDRLIANEVDWVRLDPVPGSDPDSPASPASPSSPFVVAAMNRRRMPWLVPPLPSVVDPKARLAGIDAPIRHELVSGRFGLEHRPATVSFLKLTGLDSAFVSRSAVDVVRSLDRVMVEVQRAALDHEVTIIGTDVDKDGLKVMFAAGVPLAAGLEHDRMLAMVRTILDSNLAVDAGFELRFGVNAGRVFAGPVGSSRRLSYTSLGDVTNTAARLTARAGAGQALIAPVVLQSARTPWDATELVPFAAKGKSAPLAASVLGYPRSSSRNIEAPPLPFVGRANETAIIDEAIAAFRLDGPAAVEIVGEAGLGKSRLVDETLNRLVDLRVIRVNASPFARSQGYFALQSELRLAVGLPEDGDVAAGLASLVATHLPDALGLLPLFAAPFGCVVPETTEAAAVAPQFRLRVTADLIGRLLDAVVGRTAVALIVDDTHWLDQPSCQLLSALIADPDRHWFTLCARRPEPGDLDLSGFVGLRRIQLDDLDDSAAMQLAEAFAVLRPLDDETLRAAVRRSGGTPLVLELILEALAGGATLSELPLQAEELVASRFDALPPGPRDLLRAASVLGADISTALVARLVDNEPEEVDRQFEAVGDYVIPEGLGAYRFRHAMIRETAYEGLSFADRRRMHARVVDAVEDGVAHVGDTTTLLAAHAVAAQLHSVVWRYARVAAQRAKQQGLLGQAADLAQASLGAARYVTSAEPHEVGAVAEILGDVSQLRGRPVDAQRAFRKALGLFPTRIDRCRVMWKQAEACFSVQRYVAAGRLLENVLAELADDRTESAAELKADSLTTKAAIRYRRGKSTSAIRLLNEAWAAAELCNDDARRARVNFLLGAVETDRGSRHAEFYLSEAVRLLRNSGRNVDLSRALNNLGYFQQYNGRWPDALRTYEESARAASAAGDVQTVATVNNNTAEILSDQGFLDEAERLFVSSLRSFQIARFNVGVALVTSNLARIHARRGSNSVARSGFADAIRLFTEIGLSSYAVETQARSLELGFHIGAYEGVAQKARELLRPLHESGENPPLEVMLVRIIGSCEARLGVPGARATLVSGLTLAEAFRARFDELLIFESLTELQDISPEERASFAASADTLRRTLGCCVRKATELPPALQHHGESSAPVGCASG